MKAVARRRSQFAYTTLVPLPDTVSDERAILISDMSAGLQGAGRIIAVDRRADRLETADRDRDGH